MVAAADVRGRGDSDGIFVPFINEATDGAATLRWLRSQRECSGRVGIFGSGYGAFCAWAAAVADANVDAVVSISPFGAVGEGFVHRGGAVRLDWLFWMHLIGGRTVQPANVPLWSKIHKHLPLAAMDDALGREDIWWKEWLDNLDRDSPFWRPHALADKIAALKIPGLHISGWWDGQSNGARYFYEAAKSGGAAQQLLIGPWDTAAVRRPVPQVGGVDFGPRSAIDLDETIVEFFDAHLRDSSSEQSRGIRIFITGRNEWMIADDSTLTAKGSLQLNFASTLSANTRCGDGELVQLPRLHQGVDRIAHNPNIPVNFQPQFTSFALGSSSGLVLEQAHITARDESLVYTSKVLVDKVTVIGRPKVTLTVFTEASDADIYVLLSDTFPLGARDLHLSHTAVRLGTLKSFEPGTALTVELEMDMIAHDFFPGHQIRITVTPSLFPLYARNLHTREYTSGSTTATAEIEIHFGAGSPSHVTLPIAVE